MKYKYTWETNVSRTREEGVSSVEGRKEGRRDGGRERRKGEKGRKERKEGRQKGERVLWFGLCPQKRYVEVVIPGTHECDLTGK